MTLDSVHMLLLIHASWFLSALLGCFLTTLILHVQIQKLGSG